MRNKKNRDDLISFATGAVLTWLSQFVIEPMGGGWWYVLVFLLTFGACSQALRQMRAENKVAYDEGVAVKPMAGASGPANFCPKCGVPTSTGANFCPKCGAKLPTVD